MHKAHKCFAFVGFVHGIILYMNMFSMRNMRGFTVVEMVVVVGIIGLLTSIILISVTEARQNARDKTRIADIEQLQLSFRLYREGNLSTTHSYPTDSAYDSGVEIGIGGAIDTALAPILPTPPKDPQSSSPDYGYYYHTNYNCTAAGQTVLYVQKLEKLPGNGNTVCSSGSSDMYVIILQ